MNILHTNLIELLAFRTAHLAVRALCAFKFVGLEHVWVEHDIATVGLVIHASDLEPVDQITHIAWELLEFGIRSIAGRAGIVNEELIRDADSTEVDIASLAAHWLPQKILAQLTSEFR